MIKVNVEGAKRQLDQLLEQVVTGQELVIESASGHLVRLIPLPHRMDESQHDRISNYLEELEQEHGPIGPQVMEEVREAFPIPRKSGNG